MTADQLSAPEGGAFTAPVAIKTTIDHTSTNTVDLHLPKQVEAHVVDQIGQGVIPTTNLLAAADTGLDVVFRVSLTSNS